MMNGGANDHSWAPATTAAMASEETATTTTDSMTTPARRYATPDDQLAQSTDDASGDDPAPDKEELGVAVLERLLESVTPRLPRHGKPWSDAEREAYLAAFQSVSRQ